MAFAVASSSPVVASPSAALYIAHTGPVNRSQKLKTMLTHRGGEYIYTRMQDGSFSSTCNCILTLQLAQAVLSEVTDVYIDEAIMVVTVHLVTVRLVRTDSWGSSFWAITARETEGNRLWWATKYVMTWLNRKPRK